MEAELESAIAWYQSEGDIQMITDYAFWFLSGPDSLPENLRRNEMDIPGREAALGRTRKKFMTIPTEFLPAGVGIWSKKYREHVDQLLRAMRPVLIDPEETPDNVGTTLRKKILDRSGDECPMCGANLSESSSNSSTIDHIIPSIFGGPSEEWNLRVLCHSCNSFKHVMIDPSGVKIVASRLEERIE
jgi:5-methylcytosine-specific restriction endonuclease McrA